MTDKEKNKKRAKLIIAATFILLLIVLIVVILLNKEQIQKHFIEAKAEKVGWEDSENLGDIDENANWSIPSYEIEDSEKTEEIERQDLIEINGIKYKEYESPYLNIKTIAPYKWKIESYLHQVNISDRDESSPTYGIQITLMKLGTYEDEKTRPSVSRLRNDFTQVIAKKLKYITDNSVNLVYSSIYGGDSTYGPNYEYLYLQMDNILYYEKDSSKRFSPYTIYYFTYFGDDAYAIIVQGYDKQEIDIENIGKAMLENTSYQKCSKSELTKQLNTEVESNYYKFKVSSDFAKIYELKNKSSFLQHYVVNNDITAGDYGIHIIINEHAINSKNSYDDVVYDEVNKVIMSEYLTRYNSYMTGNGTTALIKDGLGPRFITLYESSKATALNTSGLLARYFTYFGQSNDFEATAFISGELPVSAMTFMTDSNQRGMKLFITITYTEENYEIAKNYMLNMINTVYCKE